MSTSWVKKIGKKLKTLNEIMDTDIPTVNLNASIIDAVLIMTEKVWLRGSFRWSKKIKGIITDGDLRRSISKINMSKKATSIMKSKPVLANENLLISSAMFSWINIQLQV